MHLYQEMFFKTLIPHKLYASAQIKFMVFCIKTTAPSSQDVSGGKGGECLKGKKGKQKSEWVEYGISLEKKGSVKINT